MFCMASAVDRAALVQVFLEHFSFPCHSFIAPVLHSHVMHGICSGQSSTSAGFLQILQFPLPLNHSTNYPQSFEHGSCYAWDLQWTEQH
jgi:hypothetical protein